MCLIRHAEYIFSKPCIENVQINFFHSKHTCAFLPPRQDFSVTEFSNLTWQEHVGKSTSIDFSYFKTMAETMSMEPLRSVLDHCDHVCITLSKSSVLISSVADAVMCHDDPIGVYMRLHEAISRPSPLIYRFMNTKENGKFFRMYRQFLFDWGCVIGAAHEKAAESSKTSADQEADQEISTSHEGRVSNCRSNTPNPGPSGTTG